MDFCKNIRKMKEFESKILKIEELEKNKLYDKAFKALAIFLQILNIYIIKNKLKLKENIENDILEHLDIYENNNYTKLATYMREILSIYENYPSDFVELDFENLKIYTDCIVNEVF